MSLNVSNLNCDRSGRPVLRDVSFALEPGEVVGLRGPNGCGKSTLLRCLTGLLPVSSGEISLNGVRLDEDPDAYCDHIAYTGHLDAIKPQLTVLENLTFWASVFDGGDTVGALDTFKLRNIADRPAGACSAGQKRRLGLARLMVASRALWLLDEPTVSLDAASARILFDAIEKHRSAGGSAIIATHVPLDCGIVRDISLEQIAARHIRVESDPFLHGAGL